jgi:hypothetical protein
MDGYMGALRRSAPCRDGRATPGYRLRPSSAQTFRVQCGGRQVSADSRKNARKSPYALELHVRGVIHIQVERLPPVIGALVTSVVSALMAWLAAGGVH